MDKKKIEIKWLVEPEGHDYPAAKSFLSLISTDRASLLRLSSTSPHRLDFFGRLTNWSGK